MGQELFQAIADDVGGKLRPDHRQRAKNRSRVGLTPANVAVLKNGRAKAVRFSTLEAMCRVLDCQPGDLLEWVEG